MTAFVATELFEAGRMDAARHAGAQRAALEAVAAEQRGVEAGAGGAGLDDAGHGPGVDRHGADAGQGGIAAVPAARRGPDPPEHRPLGDPGGVLPGAERADRAK